jgi:hypothetical protein
VADRVKRRGPPWHHRQGLVRGVCGGSGQRGVSDATETAAPKNRQSIGKAKLSTSKLGEFHVAVVDSQKLSGLNCTRGCRLLQVPTLANSVPYLAPASICELAGAFVFAKHAGPQLTPPDANFITLCSSRIPLSWGVWPRKRVSHRHLEDTTPSVTSPSLGCGVGAGVRTANCANQRHAAQSFVPNSASVGRY